MIADVICYWKMTSFVALDGETSFSRVKDSTNIYKQICFRRLLCIKIEIDQLHCLICCVLSNYNRNISDALGKAEPGRKNPQGVLF